jgi:hypothetical protein
MPSQANQVAGAAIYTALNLHADATTRGLQRETPRSLTSHAEDQMAVDPAPAAVATEGGDGDDASDLSEGHDLRVS